MNLVEKLRGYTGNIYNEQAADRIEALEAALNEWILEYGSVSSNIATKGYLNAKAALNQEKDQ